MKKVLLVGTILLLSVVGFSQKFKVGLMCLGDQTPNSLDGTIINGVIGYSPYSEINMDYIITDSSVSLSNEGNQSFTSKIIKLTEEDIKIIQESTNKMICNCKLFVGKPGDVKMLNPIAIQKNTFGVETKDYVLIYEVKGKKKGFEYTHVFVTFPKINPTNLFVYQYAKIN